jgi:hypothetical protein
MNPNKPRCFNREVSRIGLEMDEMTLKQTMEIKMGRARCIDVSLFVKLV